MAIPGLTIIGESINDSVPATKSMLESGDIAGIVQLARQQDEGGAAYIDVNIGSRPPELMAELVRQIQRATARPLAIDSPDYQIARAGLQAYDPSRAGGQKPILNSITPLRTELFELYRIQPFKPILLVSEHAEGGRGQPCRTAEQSLAAARHLLEAFKRTAPHATNDDVIFDPGIVPIGSDCENQLHRVMGVLRMIHDDPVFAGAHRSVGLSNFTVMLPSKRRDGSPVKGPLESAFLTRAMPLGLDMVIGSVKRNYQLLPEDHPALQCFDDCLKLSGFEVLMRVRQFYAS